MFLEEHAENKVFATQQLLYERQLSEYKKDLADYKKTYDKEYASEKNSIIQKQNNGGYGYYTVSMYVDCEYNHSVGNDWEYVTYINNDYVKDGSIIKCPTNAESEIYVECIEHDSIPDISTYTYYCTIDEDSSFCIHIYNTENRGRYTGNTAKHTFYYSFDRYINENSILARISKKLPDEPTEPKEPKREDIKLSSIQVLEQEPFIFIGFLAILILCIFRFRIEIIAKKELEKENLEKIRLEEQKKAEFLSLYGSKSTEELLSMSGAPNGVTIDDDGLPAKYIDGVNIYEVYTSYNGSKYHKKTCRYAVKGKPHNLVYVSKKILPCSLCHPIEDDLAWYKKYKEILALKKKYEESWE